MKHLLTVVALLATGVVQAQTSTYTLADVALHATAANCWMVLNTTEVYDVSNYISVHPGGTAMVPYCGKDGTQAFNNVHHSASAVALESSYLIGALTAVTPPVVLPVSLALAPTNASAVIGGTVQFTASVSNSTQGVAWNIAPPTLGTISASGLFTATTVGGGTVTATSMQDGSKSASAVVTVTAVTAPAPHSIAVAINPSALTLAEGHKAQFRATLSNSGSGVKWSTAGAVGTITANGLFTGGSTTGTGTVTATAVDDPTKSAVAEVTITATSCAPQGHPPQRTDD
jgi:predicted heme/steroid binding protein